MKKSLLQKANFAPPPSLLSGVSNAVKIGAGVGGGLGLLQGAGIFESDAEKKATNVGNRLGKVLTSSTIGAGLGAGAGYGVNHYKNSPERELQRREAAVAQHREQNPTGVRKAANAVKREVDAVKEVMAPLTREQVLQRQEAQVAQEVSRKASQPESTPLVNQFIDKGKKDIETTKQFFGNIFRPKSTDMNKMIRKSANFQDPATLQRLILHGSTYIPQSTEGVVSLEATLRGKMQKKRMNAPRLPSSMGVKEINSMIESGKPVGKYFNKEIRKSANFNFVNSALVGAGKMLTQPAAKVVRKAANGTKASWFETINPFGDRDTAKANLGLSKTLHGAADYLGTDKAAKLAAIGVGGTTLVGGGLLAAKAMHKDENEARYSFNGKSANFFGGGFDLAKHDAIGKKLMQRHGTGDVQTQPDHEDLSGESNVHLVKAPDGFNYIYRNGKLVEKISTKNPNFSKTIRKSANFGMIPSQLISAAQKAAAGTAKRFGNLSPQINAANVGTAVGGTLGALEGAGVNETEEQRRSTGLIGRAGKVLGMTGLGAGVGRGVGSAAGYGIDKYQTSQKLNARNKARADAPSVKPRSINVQDEDE